VENVAVDATDANGETVLMGSEEDGRIFFIKQLIGGGIQVGLLVPSWPKATGRPDDRTP
jgi:hypothetical protein